MADKTRQNSNQLKPEQIIRAKKPVSKPKPQPIVKKRRPKKHKPRKNKHLIKKTLGKKLKTPVFVSILLIFLIFFVILTYAFVSKSIRQTNTLLDQTKSSSDNLYLIAKKEAEIIKIIGPKTKRQTEIINYQSAPKDLQTFTETDYKDFKQQCISNGKLPAGVSYEITNVIYDKFAVIKRNCNGAETSILKKFEKKWSVVFSGNYLPSCTLTNDLDIPQGASMYCDLNGVQYINPNP